MKNLISIIVPVYNAKKYLEQCLDSIIRQSYKNLEILVVDDGSTDGSLEICRWYSETDGRIRVLQHKENRGLSEARNLGLEMASGEFVGFVDADDYAEPDMFEKLHRAIVASGCDVSVCGFCKEKAGKAVSVKTFDEEAVLDRAAFLEFVFGKWVCTTVWNKLFRAEVLRGIRFPAGHTYEDVWVFPEILEKDVRFYVIPDVLYHYRQHKGSIIHSWSAGNILDSLQSKEALAIYAKGRYPEIGQLVDQYLVKIYVAHWYLLKAADRERVLQRDGVSEEEARQLMARLRKDEIGLRRTCGPLRISRGKRVMIMLMERAPGVAAAVHRGYRKIRKM